MTYKNIMVHLDSAPRTAARLDQAVSLAQRFGARLVGVFAEVDASLLGKSAEAEVREAYDTASHTFTAKTAEAGVDGVLRSLVHGNAQTVIQTVIEAARRSDLCILGQMDRENRDSRAPTDLIEQVTINCGRPVLVIPYIGAQKTLGKRALVAWNAGRESARAANDAIPLMQGAEMVTVMAVNPPGQKPLDGAGLCDHYACHGLTTSRDLLEVKDIGVADYVLSHCADMGADLLVMGGFGHYGFPHILRGGVTRDILDHMTLPVLMSH